VTSVEHDPTIPTSPNAVVKLAPGIKVLEDGLEHGGKFYFIRAFWTTMGILLSWTVWVLIPVAVATVVILLAGGIGAVIPDDDPVGEPGSDFSLSCDPVTEQC
jgi:hypothetical protein